MLVELRTILPDQAFSEWARERPESLKASLALWLDSRDLVDRLKCVFERSAPSMFGYLLPENDNIL